MHTIIQRFADCRLLVIGDSTGPVWIVDAQTEKTVHHLFGYNSQNPLVSLTPSPSGKIAIMGLRNGELHLWNTGKESGSSLQKIPHTGKVYAVLFKPDPDEETWITGGEDGKVRLWTLRANKIELVSLFDHQVERVAGFHFDIAIHIFFKTGVFELGNS